ncbi:MAG: hypothetical protein AD742_18130 [Methylibium sp. NZG]|nr:MAG: hypothetical protein AD742_18130 [Methylibium sp. NZG]
MLAACDYAQIGGDLAAGAASALVELPGLSTIDWATATSTTGPARPGPSTELAGVWPAHRYRLNGLERPWVDASGGMPRREVFTPSPPMAWVNSSPRAAAVLPLRAVAGARGVVHSQAIPLSVSAHDEDSSASGIGGDRDSTATSGSGSVYRF